MDRMADEISLKHPQRVFSIQYISQMRTGHRAISPQSAFLFAECLDIDPDYLLGKDHYLAKSYEEYLGIIGDMEKQKKQFKSDKSNYHKYDDYLRPCGYTVIEMECAEDYEPIEYTIAHKGIEATIPANEMKKFKKAIDEQIRLRMEALMGRYQKGSTDSNDKE